MVELDIVLRDPPREYRLTVTLDLHGQAREPQTMLSALAAVMRDVHVAVAGALCGRAEGVRGAGFEGILGPK